MKTAALLALGLSLASCSEGGINSPSTVRVCAAASRIGATTSEIATALNAMGFVPEKLAFLIPLIQTGNALIDANCRVLVPNAPHDDPTPPAHPKGA